MRKTAQTGGLADANGVNKLGRVNFYFGLTMEADRAPQTSERFLLETKREKNIIHMCVCVVCVCGVCVWVWCHVWAWCGVCVCGCGVCVWVLCVCGCGVPVGVVCVYVYVCVCVCGVSVRRRWRMRRTRCAGDFKPTQFCAYRKASLCWVWSLLL